MNITDDLTFEEWFDIFSDKCRSLGYFGPIDKYSFESEYEVELKTPEAAAKDFVDEITA